MTGKPSLPQFERLVSEHRNAEALAMAVSLLQGIESRYGGLDAVTTGITELKAGAGVEDAAVMFATRFAAAYGRLLSDPALQIPAQTYEYLAANNYWTDIVFSLSGFRTSDNFLSLVAKDTGNGRLSFDGANIVRLLSLLTVNTSADIRFEQFWRVNPAASALAFLNYIGSRYVFSERAFRLRERLLEWIPDRLGDVKLGVTSLSRMQKFYMNCSYGFSTRKHAIKRPLLEQMRRACLDAGVVEAADLELPRRTDRATIVIVGEHFAQGHATFRAFAPAVRSLRERFNLVAVVYPDPNGKPAAEFFDENIPIPPGDFFPAVRALAAEIVARKPALIWYLGVGMIPQVIALASLRLAPIQCASIGHNASTMSPVMDYFILPDDWIGSRECLSEQVVALPKTAMPFWRLPPVSIGKRPTDGIVRVAICASVTKLNPILLDAIARIATVAESECEFHFFSNGAVGIAHFELSRVVRGKVPRATVHQQSPYKRYMELLAQCDLFLSPFPHGGMTSIMDTFELGMPGICLDGAEPHAHADAAIFARIGLPSELTTGTIDQYVAAAVRLIDDRDWRRHCTGIVRTADLDRAFYSGDTRLFRAAMENLIWPDDKPDRS